MVKRLLVSIFLLLLVQSMNAQVNYWIDFKDKSDKYSVTKPEYFLSEKALERRKIKNVKVSFSDLPVNSDYLSKIREVGVKISYTSKWLNGVSVSATNKDQIDSIRKFSFVKNVKELRENFVFSKKGHSENETEVLNSGDLSYSKTFAFDYGGSYTQIHMILGEKLHELGLRGEGLTIAMLDAGFYKVDELTAFDSLRMQNRILGTKDFVTGDNNVYEDDSHGMMALSAIAANLPGQLIGTAPKASFWLLRTEAASTESISEEYNWVAAAEFADSVGADIISSSLGYNTFDNSSFNHTYADMDGNSTPITIAADLAASKGILVVNSAGNEGDLSWKKILAPADGDSVLAVGAVDAARVRVNFSSMGPSFDKRVKPDVAAMGKSVVLAHSGGGVQTNNGTSFSCPIIAGMAACLWQSHPTWSNMDVIKAIKKSCDHFNSPDSLTGFGIPNFELANSMLIGVKENYSNTSSIKICQNPFFNKFTAEFNFEVDEQIVVEVIDLTGKQLLLVKREIMAGSNYVTFDELDGLARGIYVLKFFNSKGTFINRIMKL